MLKAMQHKTKTSDRGILWCWIDLRPTCLIVPDPRPLPRLPPAERRQDVDGQLYDRAESVAHYGGLDQWRAAGL